MEDSTLGLLEFAVLGALAWFIVWTLIVFLQTIIYTCLSCSTAFASLYFFTLDVNPKLAQPFMDFAGYGLNTVDALAIALVFVTYLLFRRVWSEGSQASSRFASVLPWN